MAGRRRRPTFSILVPLFLIFFAVPYLFDIAYCEELDSISLSQAALIDGEEVDPQQGESPSASLDLAITRDASEPPPWPSARHSRPEACSVRSPITSISASRAPPLAR
jgi:hypothetical protein